MTFKVLLVILIGSCSMAVFGYWRYVETSHEKSSAQVGILRDLSASTPNDCTRVVGLSKRALALSDIGSKSTITLMATGSQSTAYEPTMLAQVAVPEIRLVIEGQRRAEQQRTALLEDLTQRCRSTEATNASPIFQAVKRGVEHLRGIGSPTDPRYLFVQTDGEETINAQIKKALEKAPGSKSNLPGPIVNDGVRVVFCGAAETVGVVTGANNQSRSFSGDRSPQRADRLREVWAQLFTNPDLISFEPFCTSSGE